VSTTDIISINHSRYQLAICDCKFFVSLHFLGQFPQPFGAKKKRISFVGSDWSSGPAEGNRAVPGLFSAARHVFAAILFRSAAKPLIACAIIVHSRSLTFLSRD